MSKTSAHNSADMKEYYRNLFDSIPDYWDAIYSHKTFFGHHYRRRRDEIVAMIHGAGLTDGCKILDVGCGAGGYFPAYLELGLEVTGVDVSAEMTSKAAQLFADEVAKGRVQVMQADIENLQFENDTFDAIVCAGVLMYLPSIGRALAELRRVLKPGGYAVLNTDNHRTAAAALDIAKMVGLFFRKLGIRRDKPSFSESAGKDPAAPDTKTYPPKAFRQAVERAGFGIATERGHGFGPLTFAGRSFLPDAVNIALYKLTDPLYRLRFIGRTGFTYTLLAADQNTEPGA